jgi:hypothetical protein
MEEQEEEELTGVGSTAAEQLRVSREERSPRAMFRRRGRTAAALRKKPRHGEYWRQREVE